MATSRAGTAARRFTLRYCLHSGSSRGVRDFLETSLVPFASAHPHIPIDLLLQPGRHPTLRAEFGARAHGGRRSTRLVGAHPRSPRPVLLAAIARADAEVPPRLVSLRNATRQEVSQRAARAVPRRSSQLWEQRITARHTTAAPHKLLTRIILCACLNMQVFEMLEKYRDMSGQRVRRFNQRGMGKTPSVQGEWMPFRQLDQEHEVIRA